MSKREEHTVFEKEVKEFLDKNLPKNLARKIEFGEPVSREELTDTEFDESELRKVDVGITRLRQKIEKIPKKPQFIKTIRSKGYMLVCSEL